MPSAPPRNEAMHILQPNLALLANGSTPVFLNFARPPASLSQFFQVMSRAGFRLFGAPPIILTGGTG
jgi:hypothetical protein